MSGTDHRDADARSEDPRYPPYVRTAEERRRWDLAAAVAEEVFGNPDGGGPGSVWQATRAIYSSPIPTDD